MTRRRASRFSSLSRWRSARASADGSFHGPNAIYCVKCKAKTESADLKAVTMKNGRAAAQATCVVCGARKMRFGAVRPQ